MCAKSFSDELFLAEKLENERVQLQVLPRLGANLVSLKVDGQEFIYLDKKELRSDGDFTGCFMMFPTPCRLTDAKYTFAGKEIHQKKHGEVIDIHGLIRDEEFKVARTAERLVCSIEIDQKHPVYEGYPFPCIFSLEFGLLESGAEVKFKFENTGTEDAPFGFGLHAYWRIPNERKDVFIQVPCDKALELVNLIPTGNTVDVEGTELDLRSFRTLEGIDIDMAFWGKIPGSVHGIQYKDLGKQLKLDSSNIFEHMITYAPEGEPFVCMENLTCTPDAPNVYAKGKGEVSGLKVVSPGQTIEGSVKYIVTDL